MLNKRETKDEQTMKNGERGKEKPLHLGWNGSVIQRTRRLQMLAFNHFDVRYIRV